MKAFALTLFIGAMVLLICGCKEKSEVIGVFKEVSRFTNIGLTPYTKLYELNNDFVYFDSESTKLIVIDKNGNQKAVYDRIGNGPGEFHKNMMALAGISDNIVYLSDVLASKIVMVEYDTSTSNLVFRDEYYINEGRIVTAFIGEDKLLYCCLTKQGHRFYVYDLTGKFIKKIIPNKIEEDVLGENAMIDRMYFYAGHSKGIYLVNWMTYRMLFYNNKTQNDFVLVNDILPKYVFREKNYKFTKTSTGGYGRGKAVINGIFLLNGYLIFIADSNNMDENVCIQEYDDKSVYLGKYTIETSAKLSNLNIIYSNNKDTLYLLAYNSEKYQNELTIPHEVIIAKLQ